MVTVFVELVVLEFTLVYFHLLSFTVLNLVSYFVPKEQGLDQQKILKFSAEASPSMIYLSSPEFKVFIHLLLNFLNPVCLETNSRYLFGLAVQKCEINFCHLCCYFCLIMVRKGAVRVLRKLADV